MTPNATAGFISGYRSKEAGIPEMFAGVAANLGMGGLELIKSAIPYLVVIPIAVGGGAGLIHSKLTSPAPLDISSAQKELELSELEEFSTELKRRRVAATRQGKKENSNARTLRL